MREIVEKSHPTLRKIASEVPAEAIKSPQIQAVIADMKQALEAQEDGVAIAAPQIDEQLRIFVVSGRAISMIKNKPERSADLVFINPRITKLSKKTDWVEEGCLSIRYLYGKVKRAAKTTIMAYDENGKLFKIGASGLLAQIFQHETDHLDGILFTDKAVEVEDLPPEKNEAK